MSLQKQWDLVHSLLQGARGATLRNFDVMETNADETPVKFWVEYTRPDSNDCQNLHDEIESFGYLRERADGSRWVYQMPAARRDHIRPPDDPPGGGGGAMESHTEPHSDAYRDEHRW